MIPVAVLLSSLLITPAGASVPDVHTPLRSGARAPADAAVVIGIEHYLRAPAVPYATRDAEAFYNYLVYTRGVPAARVRLLDAGASREQILEAVTHAGQQVGKDGVTWVYFAGHGAADPSTGKRLLLGDDVRQDPGSFSARGVEVDELTRLAGAGGGAAHLIVDACFGGVGRTGDELIAGRRFLVPAYATAPSGAVLEWNAAGPDQLSGPFVPGRQGAFTYFAIGALRGWADGHLDGRRDGTVTAEEAQLFVRDALRAIQITDQQPQLAVADADRRVMAQGRWFEEAPVLDARFGGKPTVETRPAPTPTTPAPTTPPPAAAYLDAEDRAAVGAWMKASVHTCHGRHAQGDPAETDWWVAFRVVPSSASPRSVMINPVNATSGETYAPSVWAMHTCIREAVRGQQFTPPRKAAPYRDHIRVEGATVVPRPAPAPTTAPAPAFVTPTPTGPAPTAPAASIPVVLSSTDGEWVDVRIDGASVAELRAAGERRITVKPGRHTLELYAFMADAPYHRAVFDTRDGAFTVAIRKDAAPAIHGSVDWYADGRGAPRLPRTGAVPAEVVVTLRSLDGQWLDVFAAGRKVAEIRRAGDTRVTLPPGVHDLQFTPFMNSEPWRIGRLDTGVAAGVTLGLHEDRGVVCYDHDGWASR